MIHCIMIMMSNKNNCSLLSCDCPFCPSSNQRWTSNVGWFHLAFIFHAYYTLLLCFLHVCTPNSHKKCFYQLSILQYFNNHFLFLKIRHTICFLPTTEHSSVNCFKVSESNNSDVRGSLWSSWPLHNFFKWHVFRSIPPLTHHEFGKW